jgi:hypothetical protein
MCYPRRALGNTWGIFCSQHLGCPRSCSGSFAPHFDRLNGQLDRPKAAVLGGLIVSMIRHSRGVRGLCVSLASGGGGASSGDNASTTSHAADRSRPGQRRGTLPLSILPSGQGTGLRGTNRSILTSIRSFGSNQHRGWIIVRSAAYHGARHNRSLRRDCQSPAEMAVRLYQTRRPLAVVWLGPAPCAIQWAGTNAGGRR